MPAMKIVNGGYFIVLEGPDCTGKSTIAASLTRALTDCGALAILTREPWGTDQGREVRRWKQHPGESREVALRRAEIFAWEDRAAHVEALIRPAMDMGAVVVCERYWPSTIAYNMAGPVVVPALAPQGSAAARPSANLVWPDLTLALRADPETLADRVAAYRGPDAIPGDSWVEVGRQAAACERYKAIWDAWPTVHPLAIFDARQPLDEVRHAVIETAVGHASEWWEERREER